METKDWMLAYAAILVCLLSVTASVQGIVLAISHNNQQSCDLQLPTL